MRDQTLSDSLQCSKSKVVVALACVVVAAWLGRAASAADLERAPAAAANPEMRLLVGPCSLLLLFETEIVRGELAFTPEQRAKFDEWQHRWRTWNPPFPTNDGAGEQRAWFAAREQLYDETFAAIERILVPAQKTRLDEITLQLYLPYALHAGCALDLDEHLGLGDPQRQRIYRYAEENIRPSVMRYELGNWIERQEWDRFRTNEGLWTPALLAELTAEQRARLKTSAGTEVSLSQLQEQLWKVCIAEATARGRLVQEPSPELTKRHPTSGQRLMPTSAQVMERISVNNARPGGPQPVGPPRVAPMPIAPMPIDR